MNRRSFLKCGAAGVSTSLCGSHATAHSARNQDPARRRVPGRIGAARIRTSCAAYSFRGLLSGKQPEMTLLDFVEFCARHDLDGTELTSYYFRKQDTTEAGLATLRRMATVNGLTISGTPIRNDFCLPPGPARDREIAHVKRWIDLAVRLGSQTIRVFAGNAHEGTSEAQARKWFVECMHVAAGYAVHQGVPLALENHGYLTRTADELIGLVEAVSSPGLGINLDTGNFKSDSYRNIEKAAPHAIACQVKVGLTGEDGKRVRCDYERVMGILETAGYRGFVAFEYEERDDPRVAVPGHLDRLNAALERVR